MNTSYGKRDIEKPKPIKARAATAATRLINLRSILDIHDGARATLTEAIHVLQVVADEKKA